MNTVLSFLTENWSRLQLQKYGEPAQISAVVVTPRFRASAHLLFFVVSGTDKHPFLVAKVPRIPGDNRRLDREVENINFVQSSRPAGFDSIPRVVAYEDYRENRILLQTALVNQTMRPAVVRKHPEKCLTQVLRWLSELHRATLRDTRTPDADDQPIDEHLNDFERVFPLSEADAELVAQTREIVCGLADRNLPRVLEHGDLSSPNILMDDRKEIGVVDWELAKPEGFPGVDLFFFLTYIAFALNKAKSSTKIYVSAFRSCFFGPEAWASPHIAAYRSALELPAQLLRPLFVVCWSQYVTSLAVRLHDQSGDEKLPKASADWLRTNRYFALWRFAVEHFKEIGFG